MQRKERIYIVPVHLNLTNIDSINKIMLFLYQIMTLKSIRIKPRVIFAQGLFDITIKRLVFMC